jgi:hypothetical protein
MLDAMNESPIEHSVCIEYEGWVPQCWPDRDPFKVTKQLLDMLERNLV